MCGGVFVDLFVDAPAARGRACGRQLHSREANVRSIFPSEAVRILSEMDRLTLTRMLDEGLPLAGIGSRVERHESTVAYWVRKDGPRAVNEGRHAALGRPDPGQLDVLVSEGKTVAEIAQTVERSKATVRYWLERYGLRTAHKRGVKPREGVDAARAAGLARAPLRCPAHGLVEHVREPRGCYRCCACRQEAVVRRRRKVKQVLVEEFGGGCRLCGYRNSLSALEFHHLNPSTKAFTLARRGAHGIGRLRAEARKCVVLCSNCHPEIESGARSISGVARLGDPG
jgi:hypothetical protein